MYAQFFDDMPANSELSETKITAKSVKEYQEAIKLRNHCTYSYLVFNEVNKLIAITLVSVNLKDTQEVEQAMTGVVAAYRGRGLSKWLKAAMFKKLIADFPELEIIETETHPENHPSRELSRQMGYKVVGTQKEFLISKAEIIKCLNAKV